jgi:hypothetical protein
MSLTIYEMPHSPYCIPITRALDAFAIPTSVLLCSIGIGVRSWRSRMEPITKYLFSPMMKLSFMRLPIAVWTSLTILMNTSQSGGSFHQPLQGSTKSSLSILRTRSRDSPSGSVTFTTFPRSTTSLHELLSFVIRSAGLAEAALKTGRQEPWRFGQPFTACLEDSTQTCRVAVSFSKTTHQPTSTTPCWE